MQKIRVLGVILLAAGIISACTGGTSAANPQDDLDLSGTWTGTLSQSSQTGPCPPMPGQEGVVFIEQSGESLTIQFGEGFDCNPAEACVFSGTIDAGTVTAANAGSADSEGGQYSSSMTLHAESDKVVQGIGSSLYTHPDMQCTWETMLVLTRD